jgi:hypothetical protein
MNARPALLFLLPLVLALPGWSCATERPQRPAHLDPSNPDAPEAPPPALPQALIAAEPVPREAERPDAGELPPAHPGHGGMEHGAAPAAPEHGVGAHAGHGAPDTGARDGGTGGVMHGEHAGHEAMPDGGHP